MDRREFLLKSSVGLASLSAASLGFGQAFQPRESPDPRLILQDQPLRRFAFGSCNYSFLDQSFWDRIGRNDPDLWIWLGDTIYGDGLNMRQREDRYTKLKFDPTYAYFCRKTPVIGTWDDHDFASDNMDGHYADKVQSKSLAMKFLGIDRDPDVPQRSGIYQSYDYGPIGRRTKVILLDLRYNQDKSRTEKVLLGEEQWLWLESEIHQDNYELLVIGSSINVCSPHVGPGLEGWHSFGGERQRLYNLLQSVNSPTLILSGDRHQAEISKFDPGHGRPVYEFMSSGLTHALGLAPASPYAMGKVVRTKNFGLIDIDWTDRIPKLFMQLRSPNSNRILALEYGV